MGCSGRAGALQPPAPQGASTPAYGRSRTDAYLQAPVWRRLPRTGATSTFPRSSTGPRRSASRRPSAPSRSTVLAASEVVTLEGEVVKLETPRLGDATDAYGRMLAYVYLDLDGDQLQEEMFNMDLVEDGYARTTTFAHSYSREFEDARRIAQERRVGLWGRG